MTITWTIDNLDRRPSDGFITTAHWRATAVDGEFSASVYGTASWSEGLPTTPYEQVTQQQVLEWCWKTGANSEGPRPTGCNKETIEASLTAQINAQKNPSKLSGTPW
jgi:hypothetical protein